MIDMAYILPMKKGKLMKFEETCPIKWNFQNMAYGVDESQNFDIIIPEEKEVHAIVYIHGGAY
jgi:hypothetical protein